MSPKRRWRAALKWTVLPLVLALAGTWATGAAKGFALRTANPAPGVRVDVGGYRMHLNCTGQGQPTVILEAGLLDFSVHWAKVQPVVGGFTRTCSYDRAGSGWSDAVPGRRTGEAMVNELRALLSAANVPPPYVLVGHSFGGMTARLFAHRHPGEVAGLVLVDAAHEEQSMRVASLKGAAEAMSRQYRSLATMSALGLLALLPDRIPDRGLPSAAARQYRSILAASSYFRHARSELDALEESFAEVRAARIATPAGMPVIVISRGQPAPIPGLSAGANDLLEREWRVMQDDLVARSRSVRHLIATRSAHDIHLQQPAVISDAVRELVTGVGVTLATR